MPPVRFRILPTAASDERIVDVEVGTGREAGAIRIGRRADVELPLPFPGLSAVHARVAGVAGGGWTVEDMGSRNGTAVGERRLAPGEVAPLAPGDRLVVGEVALVFEGAVAVAADAAAGPARVEGTGTIARRLVSDLFAAAPGGGAPELEVVGGPEAGRRLALREDGRTYSVGRSEQCDLALAIDELSREHALFQRRWEGVFVRDNRSKNGVRVAGVAVSGERRLGDGELIDLGPVALRLSDAQDRYLAQIAALGDETSAPAPPLAAPSFTVEVRPPAARRRSPGRLATGVALGVLVAVALAAVALAVAL